MSLHFLTTLPNLGFFDGQLADKLCCATGERMRQSKLNLGIMAILVYMIHLQIAARAGA